MADVSRHEPFVIKDPRLCWTFEFWKPLLDRPLCVIVYKDPIENSISLAENYLKSSTPPPPTRLTFPVQNQSIILSFASLSAIVHAAFVSNRTGDPASLASGDTSL